MSGVQRDSSANWPDADPVDIHQQWLYVPTAGESTNTRAEPIYTALSRPVDLTYLFSDVLFFFAIHFCFFFIESRLIRLTKIRLSSRRMFKGTASHITFL